MVQSIEKEYAKGLVPHVQKKERIINHLKTNNLFFLYLDSVLFDDLGLFLCMYKERRKGGKGMGCYKYTYHTPWVSYHIIRGMALLLF